MLAPSLSRTRRAPAGVDVMLTEIEAGISGVGCGGAAAAAAVGATGGGGADVSWVVVVAWRSLPPRIAAPTTPATTSAPTSTGAPHRLPVGARSSTMLAAVENVVC